MTISESRVLELLRGALADSPAIWRSARYIPATDAERGDKTIVAAARTTEFDPLSDARGLSLRPYGVHHHVLIVGWEERESGLAIDSSRFSVREP